MRIVILPSRLHIVRAFSWHTKQLSLLHTENINCSEKSYFDPNFITCPNFLYQLHFLKTSTIFVQSQCIFGVIMDRYESVLKCPNGFTEYERKSPYIFGSKGCRMTYLFPHSMSISDLCSKAPRSPN